MEVIQSRGARDAAYIKRMIKIQRSLELGGRLLMLASRYKPAWVAELAAHAGRGLSRGLK